MYSTIKLLSQHGLVQNTRKNGKLLNKNIPSMIAYMFHPAGLPFCGYSPPQLEKPSQDWAKLNSLRESIFSLCESLVFLGLSDCILLAINDFLSDSIHSFFIKFFPFELCQFLETCVTCYFTSLQFRCSHYFVCFLIQASHQFWGNK